jgi:putative ABC transport system permease protein
MAIAIGATVGVAFITGSYNRAIDQDIARGLAQSPQGHSVYVSTAAGGNGFNTDARVPPSVLTALAKLPGVIRVDRFDDVLTGHTSGQLTLVESSSTPSFTTHVFAGRADPGSFHRGQVLVGSNLARRDHLRPGSTLVLDTPTGKAPVVVQGVWDNGDATGDNVTMPIALVRRLFGVQAPEAGALIVAPQVSPAKVAVLARKADLGPYLKFSTPSMELSTTDASIAGQLAPFLVLQRALLLVSFISVLSTLLLAGAQRRREFGMLGAVGITPKELFRMVISEAVTVSLVAVVFGSVLGFLLLESLLDITPLFAGYHDSYSPDLGSLFLYGPIAVAVAVAAALWPGWQAARTPILEALSYE